MKILAISGSLRPQSSNTTILQAVVELAPVDVNISIYDGIGNLPHFNPDLDRDEALAPVIDWWTHLQAADAAKSAYAD